MSLITIDKSICTGDGLCTQACPMSLLSMTESNIPGEIAGAEQVCMTCGHCISVCPHGALTLREISPDTLSLVQPELKPSPEQVACLLKTRRSVRVYKPEPVSHDVLEKVFDTMRWAPTAANRQGIGWIVIEDPERLKRISGMIVEGLRSIPYFARLVEAWEKGETNRILRGAPQLVVTYAPAVGLEPIVDCTIALTYFELAAASYGLGTCWAGIVMAGARNNPAVLEEMGVPADHKFGGAMMVGYPRLKSYTRIPDRKRLNLVWK